MLDRTHMSTEARLRAEIEALREKNRLLEEKLESVLSGSALADLRKRFNLTQSEAKILSLLMRNGVATHQQLEDALFDMDHLEYMEDPILAARSHVKRLRRKIVPVKIGTMYSLGYEMDENNRSLVRSLLATA